MSAIARHHNEWLEFLEPSGPFLTLPVLVRVFPQGLPKVDGKKLGRLRAAYEEWSNAQDAKESAASALHVTWVQLVLGELLEFDELTLRAGDGLPSNLAVSLAEHRETLQPSLAIVEPIGRAKAGTPRLLVSVWPSDQDLESAVPAARWVATPLERMTQLCRSKGIRLGLVTNGERWTLVDAPVGQTAGYASWYAGLWLQEPITLAAFEALLGVRRFFSVAEADTIEALLDESVAFQQEVTDQLGYQVRRAVEVLVQALDRADLDRNRELLRDVPPARLYDAALTVMMRLVFLFCAEERGLLLLGDETYDANYAVSTLRALLREEADRVGVEVLERRQDAWARLLATFRAVHGGIEHEALRLPALGGSLFDPDRFPFLEGRPSGTSWRDTPASPLPIDNRTVLHLLEALQLLRTRGDGGRAEARKLSYRALDIEQIGHVYEGLLDHVAVRVDSDTLGLAGTKDKEPELSIDELYRERHHGEDKLIEFLKEHTGRSISALRRDLDTTLDEDAQHRLLVACGNDKALLKRVAPYHALLRLDVWGYPQIYRANSVVVTGGPERRQTGTHYTPKSLTEQIVTETLEPVVYVGPAEGKPRNAWKLRSAAELLDLKICDMAMGSGAFLVQVCRWLAERVVEAWEEAERQGASISADGEVLERAAGHDLLSPDREERLSLARRLVAEHCVYGVDINPMAVELAKLSLWLVTLAKGRPFGFLDHNLRCGDSLLGIHRLDQLTELSMMPTGQGQRHLFGQSVERAVRNAVELRSRLRKIPIRDIRDVEAMRHLDAESRRTLEVPECIADAFIGEVFASGTGAAPEKALSSLAIQAEQVIDGDRDLLAKMRRRSVATLSTDLPGNEPTRRPFHWPLEFPEVFTRERAGFDVLVGNPPFKRGKDLSGLLGSSYREFLVQHTASNRRGSADLVVYFFLQANQLQRERGCFGLLATNTIAEGDTRQVGLEPLLAAGNCIYSAHPNLPWPGAAAVMVSRVHVYKGQWSGPVRLGRTAVPSISAFLSGIDEWSPKRLAENSSRSYQGSNILGLGFTLDEQEALDFVRQNERLRDVLLPYMIGEDLTSSPRQKTSRWVINFWDWPLDRTASGRWEGASEEKRAKWLKGHRVPRDFPGKVAADFPVLLAIVEEKVKPERAEKKRKQYREIWWQFAEKQKALYGALGVGQFLAHERYKERSATSAHPCALCQVMISKYLAISVVPTDIVFSHRLVVFTVDAKSYFPLLQSSIHEVWARKHGGTLETRMSYTPSDAFETFPFPTQVNSLGAAGERFHALRSSAMREADIGMTALYNRFHQPGANSDVLVELRNLQREMDAAVARAYGWDDLDLEHGFHEVSYLPENDRVRFTISEAARVEVLRRLSDLNRQRYRDEVARGQHPDAAAHAVTRSQRPGRANSAATEHPSFDFEARDAATTNGVTSTTAILSFLSAHEGWHAKSDVLAATGLTDGQWSAAINDLIAGGRVKRQGEWRGARYRIQASLGEGHEETS